MNERIEFIPLPEPSEGTKRFITMVNALHEYREILSTQGERAAEEFMRKLKKDSQSYT